MSTTMAAKVVFPPPPPTINELSARQRTQLVRTSRKIEQILGAAPRFVDTSLRPLSPIHVSLPHGHMQRRLSKPRRSSVDSTSSGSSVESPPSPKHVQRSTSLSGNFSGMRNSLSGTHRTSRSTSSIPLESWVDDKAIPVLRLAVESLTLDTIPGSPDPDRTSFMDTVSHDTKGSSAHPSLESSSPRNSLVLPRLTIPSTNSLRKQKMDRLRKKLGHDVPLELVFPKENDVVQSENIPSQLFSANLDKECPPLPPPSPRPATKNSRRIASSRDSISDMATIHRAKRQNPTSSAGRQSSTKVKRKPVSAPAPPALPNAEFKRIKERLSFIIESPDEHGAGCSEEFGLSRVSSNETDLSGWVIKSHNTEIKFWSTRRGYEGWNPVSAPSFPNYSSSSISSSDESSGMEPVSPASTAATSPISPVLIELSPPTELKRRPSSYRKPPPPVLSDCY